MRRIFRPFCVPILFCITTLAYGEEKAYTVRLDTIHKVGDKWRESLTSKQVLNRIIKDVEGKEKGAQKQETTLEYVGVHDVRAVDARGRPTKLVVQVEKCKLTPSRGKPLELLKTGTKLNVEMKDKESVLASADGSTLSPHAKHVVGRFLQIEKPDEPTEADLFPVTVPKRVGESWPADEKRLIQKLRELDSTLTRDKISASAKLLAVKTIDGREHLEVRIEFFANVVPSADVPGTSPEKGSFKYVSTELIPAQTAARPSLRTEEVEITQQLRGTVGTPRAGWAFEGFSRETTEIRAEPVHAK